MTAFLACLQALAYVIAAAFLIGLAAEVAIRVLIWREDRDRRHDAEDAEVCDDWGRNVIDLQQRPVPFRESETFARIAAVIAHNEAQRTDFDGWADVFGEGA